MKTIVAAFCLSTFALTGLVATPITAKADPVGGSKVYVETIPPGYSDTRTFTFRGGEATRIRLKGDGRSCLELRVYDEFGNLVISDSDGFGDNRGVLIQPFQNKTYKVKVSNVGGASNTYLLTLD